MALAACTLTKAVLIVKAQDGLAGQPVKLEIKRTWNKRDFLQKTKLNEMGQVPDRIQVHELSGQELEFLPQSFFSNISLEQLEIMLAGDKLVTFLNHTCINAAKLKILQDRFNASVFHPTREQIPLLLPLVFRLLDPWLTILTSPMTPAQFHALIAYDPTSDANEPLLQESCMNEIASFLQAVQRDDLAPFDIAETIALNLKAAQESMGKMDGSSQLPEETQGRLQIILDRYLETTSQK